MHAYGSPEDMKRTVSSVLETIARFDQRLESATSEIAVLAQAKVLVLVDKLKTVRTYPLKCPFCKEEHGLHLWTFVQTMWYVSPRGCSDGDYWNDDEPSQCALICPSCEEKGILRIMDYPDKNVVILLTALWGFAPKEVFGTYRTGKWVRQLLQRPMLQIDEPKEEEVPFY